ncbi:universal stress protein [Hoeflea ulvae]|uniref:Universal stress protein n=1 Tax=Hoeflea ulvae TaxID=2983764 RepID=A0ABT3YGW5_9HYPH|nr:universal stress protein [Hoeflea ulvae]MCY0095150.1 universal stress protein [Hoeflea ulvae]
MQHNSSAANGCETPRVLVCIDLAKETQGIISPAKTIARALNADLAFVHVIKAQRHAANGAPIDPVEWEIMRREAKAHMERFASEHADGKEALATHLLEGNCTEQIGKVMASRAQDIAVLGRQQDEAGARLGQTAREMLESGSNSLFLVPFGVESRPDFSRILVPLDCSRRSERILPLVEKIARSENAEIVLVHAVPEPVLTDAGPGEPSDKELISRFNARNERVARKYLEHLCERICADGVRVRSLVLCGGDVRRQLAAAVVEQGTDLLVLASHGHSGFDDVPFGDVANYLIKNSDIPTMVIRFSGNAAETHAFAQARSKGIRSPGTLAQ